MSDSPVLLVAVAVAAAWLVIGLLLSFRMGRRGHDGVGWLVLGALLGPFGIVLAIDAQRHDERLEPRPVDGPVPATVGTGPVDVLVGYDGSPESAAAIDAGFALFGERLGRLTVATVVPFGGVRAPEVEAGARLRRLEGHGPGRTSDLEVLHGHPSTALRQFAIEGGYDLIAVGTRGKGLATHVLGSAASELASDSKIPVLLVGGHPEA